MVADITKILYDISQAQAQLKKLSKTADKSAKDQSKAFSKVEGRLDKLEDGLGRLDPRLAKGARGLRGIAATAGPASIALAGVGVAVAGIAANFVDLPNLLRDSSEEIDTFTKNSQQLLRLQESVSSIGDALTRSSIEEKLQTLNLQQAQTVDRQGELQNEKTINQEKLRIAQDRLRKLEGLVRESARKRAEIERDAAGVDISQTIAQETGGTTAGRGVVNLAAAAETAALEGNIEKAKALVDEAKKRSEELGNHVFFTDKISQAEGAIQSRLESATRAENSRTGQAKSQLRLQQQRVDVLKAEESQIKKNLTLVLRTQEAIRSGRRNVREQRRGQQASETVDTSARTINVGLDILNKQISTARGPVQAFTDTIKSLSQAFARGGPEFESQVKAINALEERTVSAVAAIAERTPESIQRGVKGLEAVQADLRRLEDAAPIDTAFDFNTENIRKVIQTAIDQVAPAASAAAGVGIQANQPIVEGAASAVESRLRAERESAGIVKDSFTSAADSAEKVKDNLLQLQGRPANATIPQQQATPGLGDQSAVTTRTEITVPVNVRGGLIDRDTEEQLGNIVAQQVRKQLSGLGLV